MAFYCFTCAGTFTVAALQKLNEMHTLLTQTEMIYFDYASPSENGRFYYLTHRRKAKQELFY